MAQSVVDPAMRRKSFREKYTIKQPLGHGSFGDVFLVEGTTTGETWVVKRVALPRLSDDMI